MIAAAARSDAALPLAICALVRKMSADVLEHGELVVPARCARPASISAHPGTIARKAPQNADERRLPPRSSARSERVADGEQDAGAGSAAGDQGAREIDLVGGDIMA